MFPSEFEEEKKYYEIFSKHNLNIARMIAGSKSLYRKRYPDNKIVFNANIIIESAGKVWHGDLDVTLDEENLQAVAKEIGENLYILSEMDARFGNEDNPTDELIKKAQYKIN